jgi:hypothetical protein
VTSKLKLSLSLRGIFESNVDRNGSFVAYVLCQDLILVSVRAVITDTCHAVIKFFAHSQLVSNNSHVHDTSHALMAFFVYCQLVIFSSHGHLMRHSIYVLKKFWKPLVNEPWVV